MKDIGMELAYRPISRSLSNTPNPPFYSYCPWSGLMYMEITGYDLSHSAGVLWNPRRRRIQD